MFRILYYSIWYNTDNSEYEDAKAFNYVMTTNFNDDPIFQSLGNIQYSSSTEYSEASAVCSYTEGTMLSKYTGLNVLPICRF
jgi:hypothetical protein